jgi:hypothetical protein
MLFVLPTLITFPVTLQALVRAVAEALVVAVVVSLVVEPRLLRYFGEQLHYSSALAERS